MSRARLWLDWNAGIASCDGQVSTMLPHQPDHAVHLKYSPPRTCAAWMMPPACSLLS